MLPRQGRVCGTLAAVSSALALWSWCAGVSDLLSLVPGQKPPALSTGLLTAVALVGLGMALLAARGASRDHRWRRWMVRWRAGTVLLATMGVATSASYARAEPGRSEEGTVVPLKTAEHLPAVNAVLGHTGQVQSRDYCGVVVVAEVRRKPDTSWLMVSRIDQADFQAPLRGWAWWVLALAAVLAALTGLVVWLARKHAEASAAEAHAYTQMLLRTSPIGIITYRPTGEAVSANPAVGTMIGATPEQVATQNFRHLESWRRSGLLDKAEAALASGREQHLDVHFLTSFGKEVWLSCQFLPFRHRGEVHLLGLFTDIRERLETAEALRRSEERFRTVVESSPDGIFVQTEGRFAFVNGAAARLFGAASPEQLVGQPVLDRFHVDERAGVQERIRRLNEERQAVSPAEEKCLRLDGSGFEAEVRAVPYVFEGKNGALVFFRDVTDRKRLEMRLRQAQKMEAIGQLAGGVAHDFNNILAATMLQLSLLQQNSELDSDTRECLTDLEDLAKRASGLTRQLLLFGRRSVMQVQTVDLNELLEHLLKMLRRLIGEHIDLSWQGEPHLPAVRADIGMLEQVVMNLVVNGRDAMPKGGRIHLATALVEVGAEQALETPQARPGRFARLSVTDTGCGMDEGVLKHLFEPFFTTKEVGQGTGLGLATVYGIVEQHRGWVTVQSAVGQGSTFQVFLPIEANPAEEESRAGAGQPERGRGEVILLVEDDASMRKMAGAFLRRWGYQVLEACTAAEALAVWEDRHPEIALLLTDMVMPGGMTGLELAEQLKRAKSALKVILCSGYSAELAGQTNLGSEGITFLAKPCPPMELAATIHKCLHEARP